jgi:hypothetical protein
MKLGLGFLLSIFQLLALCLVAVAQSNDALTPVYRNNQVELQDKQGQVVFWVDGWGRVHSPAFMLWQQDYNRRVHRSFRTLIGSGLSAPEGIELVSFQPPGRRGIQSTGVFAVPTSIPENGVLTRDTLSLAFFDLGIQWNYLARGLVRDCEAAKQVRRTLNCSNYQIDWRSPADASGSPPGTDPLLFELRLRELKKALSGLRRLQSLLARVVMVSAQGEQSDEARDLQLYQSRNTQCLRFSLFNTCRLEAADLRLPFDWMTLQVAAEQLPAEFLNELHQAEAEVQRHVTSSIEIGNLSQRFVSELKWNETRK